MSYRVGFFMTQTAGHVTNYRNLRRVTDSDQEIRPDWHEVSYYRDGGAIEKIHERFLPFLPTYVSGIARATMDMSRGLHDKHYDAMLTNATVGALFSKQMKRIPSMVDFDATPRQIDRMPAYESPNDLAPVAYLKWKLWHDLLHAATLLQAWSHWAKQSAIDDYGVPADRVVVNPPGVDLSFWKPAAELSERLDRPLRILFVGGDFARKGGPLLLDWFRSQSTVDCELHIVTREDVAAGGGVHVYQNMQPNSTALFQLYHQSDLFVLPSLGECFGIATIEAMAAGLPVIASDVGGTADIVESGRNGFIVPGNDGRALGEAVTAILGDSSRRTSMAQQSRQIAEQRFDVQVNARRTLGYLKQIVDARRAMPEQAALFR